MDMTFSGVLCLANAVACALNFRVYKKTSEARDMAAAIAWMGSTVYWLVRLLAEVFAATGY